MSATPAQQLVEQAGPAGTPAVGGRLGAGAVPFDLCRAAFDDRQAYHRFFRRLPETLKETDPSTRSRWVCGSTKLPNGQRADEYVAQRYPYKPPASWQEYDRDQRTRWRLMVERDARFERFLQKRPHLKRSKAPTYREFARAEAAWLVEAGKRWWPCGRPMPATKTAIIEGRRALQERREVCKRGRPRGSAKLAWHPRAAQLFDRFYWTEQKRDAATVLDLVRALAHKEGFTPPTEHMVRARIAAVPEAARVRMREGAKRFNERCVPKGRRTRKAVRGWASFDGRKVDFWARVPDGHGGVKAARLLLSGCYLPFSRKWSALRFGLTENFELIAATVRDAVLRDGLPRVAHTDNGSAYDALTGTPRGTPAQRDSFARGGVAGFFGTFDVRVVKAEPYAGYQKAIESAWNAVKRHLDRWVSSFCGGSPAERPEKLTRWLRANVDALPTLGQCQAWAGELLELLNAKPRKSLGGLSANLHHAQRGPTRRAVDADTIDVYLTPVVAERVCGRDGVTLGNIRFLPDAADLLHVQGKRVGVRRDADDAGVVTLCGADGKALCRAYAEHLAGAGREAARLAKRRAAEYRRAARKYFAVRERAFSTETSEILRARREFAQLEEAQVARELGEAAERPTKIIRADLVASAKACKARDAQRAARRVKRAAATGTHGRERDELIAELLHTPAEREPGAYRTLREYELARTNKQFRLMREIGEEAAERRGRAAEEQPNPWEQFVPANPLDDEPPPTAEELRGERDYLNPLDEPLDDRPEIVWPDDDAEETDQASPFGKLAGLEDDDAGGGAA